MKANKKTFVEPDISELHLAAQWRRLRDDLHPPRSKRSLPWWLPLMAGGAVAVVAMLWLTKHKEEQAEPVVVHSGVFQSASNPSRTIALPDGSTVQMGPNAVFAVLNATADGVSTKLDRGDATFHVAKRHQGLFKVHAAEITVVVVGTTFNVAIAEEEPHTVTVSVSEGIVRVERPLAAAIDLRAGETWSSSRHVQAVEPAPPVAPMIAPRPTSAVKPLRRAGPPAPTRAKQPTEDLFAAGNKSRLSGDLESAAQSFDRFRLEHPRDPRAAVAAFESARIRMDVFGDGNRAAALLQSALDLNPPVALREDIEARLVQALSASGRKQECARRKALYLNRYSKGRHATDVEKLCGTP